MHRRILLSAFLSILLLPGITGIAQASSFSDQTPPPQVTETPNPSNPHWWMENAINQIAPDTLNAAGQFITNPYNTCGPTALAMVINYTRTFTPDAEPGNVTPVQVMQAVKKSGYYSQGNNSGILGIPALIAAAEHFQLEPADQQPATGYMSLDKFLEQVRAGTPGIAALRYHYDATNHYIPSIDGSGNINHFVVVFGTITLRGQEQLWVLNPHPGAYLNADSDVSPTVMSISDFQNAWALSRRNNEYGLAVFLTASEEQASSTPAVP